MKKTYLLLFSLLFLFTLPKEAFAASPVEISPEKDTYLSLSGALSDPSANFGLADYIYVGDGWDGDCIGLFEFDLSWIPSSISSYTFSCDMTVYGDQTRTLKVFLLTGIVWGEVSITASECPFDCYAMWTDPISEANCTTVIFGGSQEELTFTVHINQKAKITLVFAFSPTDSSWLDIRSQENSASSSNMAHLEYNAPSTPFDLARLILFIIGAGIGVIVFTVVFLKDRAKKKAKEVERKKILLEPYSNIGNSPYPMDQPSNPAANKEISCPYCGMTNPISAKFCNSCGKNL